MTGVKVFGNPSFYLRADASGHHRLHFQTSNMATVKGWDCNLDSLLPAYRVILPTSNCCMLNKCRFLIGVADFNCSNILFFW